ncbi:TPA: hypothetical protein ACP2U2_000647 [Listeria monocytogenes]|uniref:hypothetical protein n=1 Tax=Listeria TaxID=1637 RepID=UPI00074D620F|nr:MULTISPECIES: hypothetical protein [Listeria]EAE3024512.1 hypothetical protein [Listeria monocytogenes]EAE4088488.1 hypothetical protein [Listeria monocytogenes]EAE4593386.1 hypothetical protein [Listeria monocytogenes]EAF1314635.1 hypothetical protein [Listeria monocytogenes]EEO9457422.1 hypothetical protein [Listeria monocytogenes]
MNGLLIKFTDLNYVESVSNGKIHFESLGKYQDMELVSGNQIQGDKFEGGIRSIMPSSGSEEVEMIVITKESRQTYVSCFTILEFGKELIWNRKSRSYQLNPVVIEDLKAIAGERPASIFNLLDVTKEIDKVIRLEAVRKYGRVNYVANNKQIKETPLVIDLNRAFIKGIEYETQHEWRIACAISKDRLQPFDLNLNLSGKIISNYKDLTTLRVKRNWLTKRYKFFFE